MKTSSLFLALSLAANVALAAVFLIRPAATVPSGDYPVRSLSSSSTVTTGAKNNDALRSALASGDVAALQAAGLSPELARELVAGRALGRLLERSRTERSGDAWWRNKKNPRESREEQLKAQREFSDALVAAFGEDPFNDQNARLSFLPAAKRDALRKITQDYDEMLAQFGTDGPQLASDREKQKLLRAERDRDIAALLSPEEFAEYQMRTSATAATIRSRYGDAIESEDDFRKIYALQKAFDDKFPALSGRITPDMMAARTAAAQQLQDDLRATLGNDKYAALRRASDTDVRTVDALASRLNLPANTTDNILSARDSYAAESQRINADTSLSPAQRRAQIQDLGNRAKSDVVRTLGAEGADAYSQRSQWLNMLQSGMAFSTTPQPGSPSVALAGGGPAPSVYPVLPAGANTSGTRTMVVTGGVDGGGGGPVPGGALFTLPAGGGGGPSDNVRVMSFTATSTEGPSTATSTQTTTGGTPAQPPPPPTPKQ